MKLRRLLLKDFRNYTHLDLEPAPGLNLLVGANAQGKTNLLEAISYLATGTSHRVPTDAPLVRAGAEAAVVRVHARVDTADGPGRPLRVELELRPGGRNRAQVNGQPRPRTRDAFGLVRSVLFAPEDIELVRGDPAGRRRFLDELLAQRRPAFAAARQEYERVLRQRNSLLKTARTGGPGAAAIASTLETWTESLVTAGATIMAARIAALHALAGPTAAAYAELVAGEAAAGSDEVVLAYELSTGRRVVGEPGAGVPDPGELAAELRAGLEAVAAAERERGVTLAGPHRDELFLGIGGLPAKGYASHGESWSLALALRLASREVLREVGEEPVVLLDDVFAELDSSRRERLAARCAAFEQVIVTAAVDEDVPLAGPRHLVRRGSVTTEPVAVAAGDGR